MDHYRKLIQSDHDTFMKLNLSFELKDLHFGSERNDENKDKINELLEEMKLSK